MSPQGDAQDPHGRPAARHRFVTRRALDALAETDAQTAAHSDDVVLLARAIGKRLGLGDDDLETVATAAAVHDIGKIAVGAEILTKPAALDSPEWEIVRRHTVEGQRMLAQMPGLEHVAPLVRSAHERFDGRGYPDGLSAADIPLTSRIVFCADAFHAIRSDRPYRPGRPAADALAEIRRNAGSQFDPDVVRALDAVARELRLAPPERPSRSTQRLLVLLLILCLGGGGSAIAIETNAPDPVVDARTGPPPAAQPAPRAAPERPATPVQRRATRPRARGERAPRTPHTRAATARPARTRVRSAAGRFVAAGATSNPGPAQAVPPRLDPVPRAPTEAERRRLLALVLLAQASRHEAALPPEDVQRRRRALATIAVVRLAEQRRVRQAASD